MLSSTTMKSPSLSTVLSSYIAYRIPYSCVWHISKPSVSFNAVTEAFESSSFPHQEPPCASNRWQPSERSFLNHRERNSSAHTRWWRGWWRTSRKTVGDNLFRHQEIGLTPCKSFFVFQLHVTFVKMRRTPKGSLWFDNYIIWTIAGSSSYKLHEVYRGIIYYIG